MDYVRTEDVDESGLTGYWTPDKGVVLVKMRAGLRYSRKVTRHGLVTFIEAAALIQRRGRPVSRIAIYQWAKAGKIPFEKISPRPGREKINVVRLSVLRKFAERWGFECLNESDVPPSAR